MSHKGGLNLVVHVLVLVYQVVQSLAVGKYLFEASIVNERYDMVVGVIVVDEVVVDHDDEKLDDSLVG